MTSANVIHPVLSTTRFDAPSSQTDDALPTVDLLGVRLHAITSRQCVSHLFDMLDRGQGGWIVTPNLDHLRRLTRDASFANVCREADLLVPDGMPLIWASRLQGTP